MKKQRKRIYTALLCTCFLFSTASVPVSAAETEQEEEMTTLSNTKGVVTVESVQAMIDALPDAKDINDDNIEEVRTQFQAVVDAMQQLTDEEQKELNTSRYRKVAAVLYGPFLGVPIPIPGTDVEWMISQYEDGVLTDWTLTISGKGAMPDFEGTGDPVCPWENEKQKIKKVIIEEGVTNIGKSAFRGCSELAEVHISKTVKKIGISAFQDCTALTQIDIPDSVNSVGSFAFIGCTRLTEVHTHWKNSYEINFGLFVFYKYGDSWPENRVIYVPDGYKDNFKSNPNGAWGEWNVQGENYTVSFDGGNASGYMQPVGTSGDYTLPDCGFTYDTAAFEYWALESSDGKKAGYPRDVFPVTEDVTLYANWTLIIVIPDPEPPTVCIHNWGEWTSNGNGTHTHTCLNNSSHTETGNCSGGTATCTAKAVCEICNTAYGELNASNHTGGTEVRGRVEATTSADGYTGDTYCKGCNAKIATGESIPKKDSGDSPSGGSSSGGSSSSSGGGGGTTYYTLTFETNGGDSIQAIRAARGKTLDLSAYTPMRDGYDFGGWYADSALTQRITEIKLSGSKTVYADWKKREPDAVKNPFADVNAGDWFYRDVLFSYEKGLMSGMDAAAFAPYANTTRAQIAVIFYRMEGSPAVEGENSFTDVVRGSGTAWFYDAVTWAQQNGIMGGYSNSSFAPNDPITREQLAAIFYRYAQYKGYDTTQGGMAIREFDDYESISDYAMGAMAWAVNTGLVKGDSNLLYPKGTATRAELAALFHRFAENGMK
nr:S-layer homology domain-containing protein [uncultured Anaerotignum sp.]